MSGERDELRRDELQPETEPERGPETRAVGLRYDPEGDAAPRLVSKGRGELAERILAVAAEHGVPIHRDPDLLELLTTAELGEEIPAEVYGAVARLVAFLWGLNEALGE